MAQSKRKPSYEQALGMQKGLAKSMQTRRRQAQMRPTLTDEQNAQWEADKKKALEAYRARKAKNA